MRAIVPLIVLGAFLTGEQPARPPARPPERPIIPPAPRPQPVADFVQRLRLGSPASYRGVTIYPLYLGQVLDNTNYLTADEALAAGCLSIEETGTVGRLIATNHCARYVFLLGGKAFAGGRQNRTLRQDVLLPPHSGPVELPTYCIEEQRWSGGARFDRSALPNAAVRSKAQYSDSQREVWSQVSTDLKRLGAVNATSDALRVYEKQATALSDYRSHFPVWEECVGVIVLHYGHIAGMDAFCNGSLFRKLRDQIIDSYCADVIGLKEVGTPIRGEDPEQFLRSIITAGTSSRPSPGVGELISFSGGNVQGSALAFNLEVVHLNAVPLIYRIMERLRD